MVSRANTRKTGRRWLTIATRILGVMLSLIIVVGFLLSLAGIVGIWVAFPLTHTAVTDVATTTTSTLANVNNGLERLNNRIQDTRKSLAQVNAEAAKLGNHAKANDPAALVLGQFIENNLAPRMEQVRTTALGIHDAVVSFNGTLVALNRLPGVDVPTLSNQLSAVSERTQQVQTVLQDVRRQVEDVKAGLVTQAQETITKQTGRIDAPLATIQATIHTYQAMVTNTQTRVTTARDRILLLITLLAVSLAIILILYAVGQVLLLLFCWRYVRTGRLSSSSKKALTPP